MNQYQPHEHYMRLALDLARKGQGYTSPNPMVGALVVADSGAVVGQGYHQRAGGPHAEVHALQEAGAKAHNATLYVTLEPCCVHGKTPPCTTAIMEAGVRRVVYATQDPNPAVAGRGKETLERAGIEVLTGILDAESAHLNRHFNKHIVHRTPYITMKTAITLDGKMAVASGASRWVTGEQARRDGHRLRGEHEAIAVGIGTVLADDPLLSCRHGYENIYRHPHVIVFDSSLRIPRNAALLRQQEVQRKVIVVTDQTMADTSSAKRLQEWGAQLVFLPRSANNKLPLPRAMELLYRDHGITSILVEGGAALTSSILRAGLEDEHVIYMAPKLFGAEGMTWTGALGVDTPDNALALEFVSVHTIGKDLRIEARRTRGKQI
ncbi:bifunctional diaminohydroxyphosphoribosylaminopyrimidine deaminase/5-amino-6-(5-phosphoribosylamino)uracil reductase RibD [Desulfurispira natronophila]|uniref:Riboflavin biosynthesis protein RibD n=1 Tax=Desulfurispira natronophila TaxID=682562 RepID=A0A7W7Y647_9BACT|nr:bifunctional diaminohydroxyphosphoribosylaminopyrimidine deaminase/5-amino-6-(5-phosphoribosylamino)uracil reductase RibD [Desulfurispira natronophila]MBB5022798.1 diaminohydroxyphosphoribosylaminopyrimidine deaminase/5-amino-6-(5-phosphoribosylamino)uracil reductase [Desulfurispira natronophila]